MFFCFFVFLVARFSLLASDRFSRHNDRLFPALAAERLYHAVETLPQYCENGDNLAHELQSTPHEDSRREQEDREHVRADQPSHLCSFDHHPRFSKLKEETRIEHMLRIAISESAFFGRQQLQ